MKKLLPILLSFLIVFLVGFYWWQINKKPVSTDTSYRSFLITKGISAAQVGNKLKEDGFIKNPLAFKFYIQLTGKADKIQAGEYSLSPSLSLQDLVALLDKGPVEIWVTIPEGLTNEEIAQKFASALDKDSGFVSDFLAYAKNFEGYLFPDTYLFPKSASPSLIVDKMTATFEKKVPTNVTGQQVIMASILEKETKTQEERPIVAGILYKRLEAGWPLQVDAAVETYKVRGLPAAPICNPGLSSILASQNPQDSPYWFYLHDSKGNIHYARTIQEHNVNISKYL